MYKRKNNGFTLVELLAVIVILAIILVIAVPAITKTIEDATKGSFESSAKLIASSAESQKISYDILGISKIITCSDVSNLTGEDYDNCIISFNDDGKAEVTLIGKGKFLNMNICHGSKESATITEGECPLSASEEIELLSNDNTKNGDFERTDDGNIRYTGSNPNNFVEFGNDGELWRIIGIFNVSTSSGNTEKLLKIVRNTSLGKYSWDSSVGNNNYVHDENEVNDGWGVNQWGEIKEGNTVLYSGADLKSELNELYLKSLSGYCMNAQNEGRTKCDFTATSSTKGISAKYAPMIEDVVWNTGAFLNTDNDGNPNLSVIGAYSSERGSVGKVCTDGYVCTDSVQRTTTWTGKVGLIYPSDYGFASRDTSCRTNIHNKTAVPCKNDNWLDINYSYWTLSPVADSWGSNVVWYVTSGGYIKNSSARGANGVRPVVYLTNNVSLDGGNGTEGNPYKLKNV